MAELMRRAGLRGEVRGKTVRATVPGVGGERATDKVNRNFTADRPR